MTALEPNPHYKGPFKCYVMETGCQISRKKHYKGARNVINVMREWVGVKLQEKCVTKIYGSTLLALSEGGSVKFPLKIVT